MTTPEHLGFRALADPTRRSILRMLANDNMTIAQVADNFDMTRAAVKKHLTILQEGNLIAIQTDGRTRLNSLNPDGLRLVFDWFGFFDAFWDSRLDALRTEIEKDIQ